MSEPHPSTPSRPLQPRGPDVVMTTGFSELQAPAGDAIEVADLVRLFRRHSRAILAVAGVFFALGMAFALGTRMRFASTARIYLGELEDKGLPYAPPSDEIELAGGGRGDLGSEIEILRSRSLVTRAILDAGLNVTVTTPSWSPPRYFTWLLARRSTRLLDAASRELSAVNTYLIDRSAPEATYDVLFANDVDYEVRLKGNLVGRGKLGDQVACDGLSVHLVPGTERGPTPGARYQIDVRPLDEVIDAALKSLEISTPANKAPTPGETLKVANLYFSDKSPQKAAGFLDHLMLAYMAERHAWKTENATAAETFLTTQLAQTRSKLDELQNKLAAYRADNGVVVLDNEAKAMIEQIGVYEEQRVAARLEVDSLASVNEQLSRPNPPVEAYMLGEAKDDSVLMGLASSLSLSQQRLASAEARYNDPAPEVRTERAQVASQLQGIRSYVKTRLNRARESLHTLDGVISQYEDKLKTVPGAEVGLAQLTRETEVYGAMYQQLLRQQQETALVKASAISKNRVLDPPEVPYHEELVRLEIGLISGPAGLVLGAIFVLVRSLSSGRLQHRSELRRYLAEAPVLATIPHVARRGEKLPLECSEAFRTLRANVYRACWRERGNVVLFTSPCSGDGKTMCANLLASSLARGGSSVLLVDTGLPRAVREAHDGEDEAGLGEVLLGHRAWRHVTRDVTLPDGHGFQAIPAGVEGSTDLLSSDAMSEFIEDARTAYDFILMEAPSYPAVSDTLVLAPMADCVVNVIRLEHTPRNLAEDNIRQLSASTARYGLLLNDVRS